MALFTGPMIDVLALLSAIAGDIQGVRVSRGLPALICDAASPVAPLMLGKENVRQERAPPLILFVPTGTRVEAGPLLGMTSGQQFLAPVQSQVQKTFYWGWLAFDVHLWGDDDPRSVNPLLSFNNTIELYREVIGACIRQNGGIPGLKVGRAEWRQGTDDAKTGRLLVVPIELAVGIADEPYTYLPIANPGVPGSSVQFDVTVQSANLDGSTTVTGTLILP